MFKEDFKEMMKCCKESKITISDTIRSPYSPIMTIYFFLTNEKKLNSGTQVILRKFNDSYSLTEFEITVEHNKKSRDTKKEEEKALSEFLAELVQKEIGRDLKL